MRLVFRAVAALMSLCLVVSVVSPTFADQYSCLWSAHKSGAVTVYLENGDQIKGQQYLEETMRAELSLYVDVPTGTEIEVWPVLEGEVPAWADSNSGFARNIWITDARTIDLVRFNVSEIVGAWADGRIPNLGFLVRVPADEEGTEKQGASGVILEPKDIELRFYFAPSKEKPDGRKP